MSHSTLETGSLTALFHQLVRAAMAVQQVESSETTEFYLVQLLEGYARPGRELLDRPLALDYLEAFHLPASQRYEKLKRVADTALQLLVPLRGRQMECLEVVERKRPIE